MFVICVILNSNMRLTNLDLSSGKRCHEHKFSLIYIITVDQLKRSNISYFQIISQIFESYV